MLMISRWYGLTASYRRLHEVRSDAGSGFLQDLVQGSVSPIFVDQSRFRVVRPAGAAYRTSREVGKSPVHFVGPDFDLI